MSLNDIKNSFVQQKIQILEIDAATTIIASDNAICNLKVGDTLKDINPFFYSLEAILDDSFSGIKYPCVNLTVDNENSIVDIEVVTKGKSIYVLLVDFTEHYTDSHPLVQEKNEAQIEKSKLTFERELLYAKEEFKNQFLSHLNHDIRSPLNNLLGFVDILLDTNLDFQQKEYVNVINKTGLHIKVLMDDLLDISKIETGNLEIRHIPFNLIQIIVNITKHFQAKYIKSPVQIDYHFAKDLPQKLKGDPTRLNQILYNLIENAFLNTTQGTIDIHVRVEKSEEKNALIAIDVIDTGLGIPKDKVNEVFESYSQLQLSKIKPIGQGLGLKIVKDLSTKMGGSVTVKSIEKSGSTFTVLLPFETRETDTKKKTVPKGSGIVMSKRILVIEDEQTSQMLLMKQFLDNDEGFVLELAKNGTHAKQLLERKKYAVIILKSKLEDMRAKSFITYLRKQENKDIKNIPVVVATASAMSNERQEMMDSGATIFLAKPYSKKDLFKALKKI